MQNRPRRWANLLLFLALFLGAIVRFAPTLLAHSPINDGGLFYTMIDELKANSFLLPAYTAYNHLQIPFAYPPLSLYLGALLSGLGVPTIEVLRWVPASASTISILAFWWMASKMLDSSTKASVAAAVYALMPRAFSWYIMGGGLSRSLGILFLLLTCGSTWLLFTKPGYRQIILTSIFGAAAILSHPETALHTVIACGLICLFKVRSRRALFAALSVTLGVIALTGPWWGTILAQHGLSPFQSALQTGAHGAQFWIPWITFDFAQEPFVTVFAALGMLGLLVQLVRREWFLPVWLFVPFLAEPRSAPAIAALPLAVLAGYGLTDFVLPHLPSLASATNPDFADWTELLPRSPLVRVALGFVLLYGFFGAFAYDLSLAQLVIPPDSRAAMQWVQKGSPTNARFVVLSGSVDPFSDASAEWFPVLAGRPSINTLQGREWVLGKGFMPFLEDLKALQACADQSATCVEDWAASHATDYNYIYLEEHPAQDAPEASSLLLYSLRQDQDYILVFENSGTVIFRRR